ncbi:alpha/beta hydrolase [Kribbella sindirgiensis]|uniref:Alpha/beta hydrolase n=1 Tax=Kribbella sindirgiensis TaxID=1124744 RepID=A0A4R0IPZ0_9ACTN|nr:alpha/beta hydrolase [Kribbella sindirgiensis]TCC35069.1 alpha/beta hydrolase [Kribbella sindirgiensis]
MLAPDRPQRASAWDVEVAALGEQLAKRSGPVRIVGASNGCTVAVLLALVPELVDRGCPPAAADELLAGGILRGVTDEQVTSLTRIRVAVLPSVPENPSHQWKTVDALLRSIRGSCELAGCPEPPTPAFRTKSDPPYLDQLLRTIVGFVN